MSKPDKLSIIDMTGSDKDQQLYDALSQQHQESPSDEVSMSAITELFDIENKLKTISRLKFEQVAIITKLYMYSDTFKTDFTSRLADLMLKTQISVGGLGRKEIVQLVQQRSDIYGEGSSQRKSPKDIFR